MTRVVEFVEDFPALADAIMAMPKDQIPHRLRGTVPVECWGCHRAAIVTGPEDVAVMLEMVDVHGWSLFDRKWYCPSCPSA